MSLFIKYACENYKKYEEKKHPTFDDELVHPYSHLDTAYITYQSDYSAESNIITDRYVARTPEGNFIDLFYSDEQIDVKWDPSEVSSIQTYYVEHSGGTNWYISDYKYTQSQIDAGERLDLSYTFTQYIVTDNYGNDHYTYIMYGDKLNYHGSKAMHPSFYHDYYINEDVTYDEYMDPWTLYLPDGSTEVITHLGWVNDYFAGTKEGIIYEQLSGFKLGFDYYDIKTYNASQVESIIDSLESYYDFMDLDKDGLDSYLIDTMYYVYDYLIDTFSKDDIFAMTTKEAEPYIEEAIYLYIENITANPVEDNDFNITWQWYGYGLLIESTGYITIEPTEVGNWYSSINFGNEGNNTPDQSHTFIFEDYLFLEEGNFSQKNSNNENTWVIVGAVLGSVAVVSIGVGGFIVYKKHKNKKSFLD